MSSRLWSCLKHSCTLCLCCPRENDGVLGDQCFRKCRLPMDSIGYYTSGYFMICGDFSFMKWLHLIQRGHTFSTHWLTLSKSLDFSKKSSKWELNGVKHSHIYGDKSIHQLSLTWSLWHYESKLTPRPIEKCLLFVQGSFPWKLISN